MKKTIRLIENESGDWKILLLNEKVYEEGHSIPDYTWINLIHDLRHEVSIEEIADEDIEGYKNLARKPRS